MDEIFCQCVTPIVLHGANDPLVPKEQVKAFETEMRQANVKWQLVSYPQAMHGFTNSESGDDPSKAVVYNKNADERLWGAMKQFVPKSFNISQSYIILPTDGGISQNYILER